MPSGALAAPAIAERIDFLIALIIGATGPSPVGSATRFSPMIAPLRVTRHDCTAPGMSSTPQMGRAFGENQSGLAGLPPVRLDGPGSVSTRKLLSIRG